MNFKLPTAVALSLVLLIALVAPAAGQQKQQTPTRTPLPSKTQPAPAATPAPTPTPPPPTFDTLLAAGSYKIYGEVRSVGQLIKSNSVNEILEPILKLAAPPKEFRTVVKWLNTHADEVMSSRMLFATSPTTINVSSDLVTGREAQTSVSGTRGLPSALVAIEFATPEDAAKFQQKLDAFLKGMLQPPAGSPSDQANKDAPPPPPAYHLQQAGSLILITSTPVKIQNLRPAGSKLLAEDVNFRVARNRFNTESIFIYFDVDGISKEDEAQQKRYEEARKQLDVKTDEDEQKAIAEAKKMIEEAEKAEAEKGEQPATFVPEKNTQYEVELNADGQPAEAATLAASPSPFLMNLGMFMGSVGNVEAKWPTALGIAISLEGESFDVRAMMVNAPGEKSDPIPFLPILAPGPAIAPEAPNILPADTEMLVTMSLDLSQIYAALSKPQSTMGKVGPDGTIQQTSAGESTVAAIERQLKIKIKEELLPLIGPEIVVSVPMSGMDWFQPPKTEPAASSSSPPPGPVPGPSPSLTSAPSRTGEVTGVVKDETKTGRSVAVVIGLKDKEGMRTLLPKIVESVGFKGAASLAQTERREDTELVSYANMIAYAFIGNFLVISPDVATTRHIVDSYLKHQTLAGDPNFKNYTRWQPRQVHGQVYISPSLMESYRTWVQQPTAPIDEQTRAFLTRFSIVAQPVTYSLSNEGFGPLHELHLPKNLVLLLVAAASGTMNAAVPAHDVPTTAPVAPPVNPKPRPF